MSRFIRTMLLCVAMLAVVAPATSFAATGLDADLATLWTKVLETPSPQNSFGTGGQAFACWDLGNGTVAPFAPSGVKSCTVAPGTPIFVTASSVECSTFEGTPVGQQATCARQTDAQTPGPTVTVDGTSVPVSQVETGRLDIVLPADNLFGLPAGTRGVSHGHGWVALVSPLSVGAHKIVITNGSSVITTTLHVGAAG